MSTSDSVYPKAHSISRAIEMRLSGVLTPQDFVEQVHTALEQTLEPRILVSRYRTAAGGDVIEKIGGTEAGQSGRQHDGLPPLGEIRQRVTPEPGNVTTRHPGTGQPIFKPDRSAPLFILPCADAYGVFFEIAAWINVARTDQVIEKANRVLDALEAQALLFRARHDNPFPGDRHHLRLINPIILTRDSLRVVSPAPAMPDAASTSSEVVTGTAFTELFRKDFKVRVRAFLIDENQHPTSTSLLAPLRNAHDSRGTKYLLLTKLPHVSNQRYLALEYRLLQHPGGDSTAANHAAHHHLFWHSKIAALGRFDLPGLRSGQVNDTMANILGLPPSEASRDLRLREFCPDLERAVEVAFEAPVNIGDPLILPETQVASRTGSLARMNLEAHVVVDESSGTASLIVLGDNLNEEQRLRAQLARSRDFDHLTGLRDGRFLVDMLELAVRRSRNHGSTAAIILVSLRNFRTINESLGRKVADRILAEFGARFKHCGNEVPSNCFRLGGVEFAILAEPPNNATVPFEIVRIKDRIYEAVKEISVEQAPILSLDCDVGFAVYPFHGNDADKLLSFASAAIRAHRSIRAFPPPPRGSNAGRRGAASRAPDLYQLQAGDSARLFNLNVRLENSIHQIVDRCLFDFLRPLWENRSERFEPTHINYVSLVTCEKLSSLFNSDWPSDKVRDLALEQGEFLGLLGLTQSGLDELDDRLTAFLEGELNENNGVASIIQSRIRFIQRRLREVLEWIHQGARLAMVSYDLVTDDISGLGPIQEVLENELSEYVSLPGIAAVSLVYGTSDGELQELIRVEESAASVAGWKLIRNNATIEITHLLEKSLLFTTALKTGETQCLDEWDLPNIGTDAAADQAKANPLLGTLCLSPVSTDAQSGVALIFEAVFPGMFRSALHKRFLTVANKRTLRVVRQQHTDAPTADIAAIFRAALAGSTSSTPLELPRPESTQGDQKPT